MASRTLPLYYCVNFCETPEPQKIEYFLNLVERAEKVAKESDNAGEISAMKFVVILVMKFVYARYAESKRVTTAYNKIRMDNGSSEENLKMKTAIRKANRAIAALNKRFFAG